MVEITERKSGPVYTCELCGHGYRELEVAELCEESCDLNGKCSPKIIHRAVREPSVLVIPVA
jgi:hypothetical protein